MNKIISRTSVYLFVFAILPISNISVLANTNELTSGTGQKKVAVMYFENRSPRSDWQWLSKGLCDMLITDLSASSQLVIVERERLNEIVKELQLEKAGILDQDSIALIGRTAKVDWVLFGSYMEAEGKLRIEAHILDLKAQDLIKVEWVEGNSKDILKLEKRLVQQLLAESKITVTEQERLSIMYVQTDSVPAFQHYSQSLDKFDKGQWFEALGECRLAVSKDAQYVIAKGRLAELYYQINRPDHALIEYESLVSADPNNTLPEHIYYKMAKLIDGNKHRSPINLYQKIISRHPELNAVFDADGRPLDDPPIVEIQVSNPRFCLEALEQLAIADVDNGNQIEAAKKYWQICTIIRTSKLYSKDFIDDIGKRCGIKYADLYLQLVNLNLDYMLPNSSSYYLNRFSLAPVFPVPENEGVFYEAEYSKNCERNGCNQKEMKFSAPKDMEIAEFAVTVITDFGDVEICCGPLLRGISTRKEFKAGAGKQTAVFELLPGNRRAGVVVLGQETFPEVRFKLRRWSGSDPNTAKLIDTGTLIFDYQPDRPVEIFVDNNSLPPPVGEKIFPWGTFQINYITPGKHIIDINWRGGGRSSTEFNIVAGQMTHASIHKPSLSPLKIANRSGYTNLLVDHKGKIWLLWDQSGLSTMGIPNPAQDSDLYYATSMDGTKWTEPQKIPVSSPEMDMMPILQQDGFGTYWLVWISNLTPDDPKRSWISSSSDGLKWTFPRKVEIPKNKQLHKNGLIPYTVGSFSIDHDNNFWATSYLVLYKSEDHEQWVHHEDKALISITHDYANNLAAIVYPKKLYIRLEKNKWKECGEISNNNVFSSALCTKNHDYIVAFCSKNNSLFIRKFNLENGWSKPVAIETHFHDAPEFPSIAVLPKGDILIAYSSKEGLITKLVKEIER